MLFCHDQWSLREASGYPNRGLDTALLAPTQDQLETLGWFSQLSQRLHIMLVPPDHHPRTTSHRHAPQPRFIIYADANWQELVDAL